MWRKALLFMMSVGFIAFNSSYAEAAVLTRGPYLQQSTPDSVIIVWRTDTSTDSVIDFGTSSGNLNQK